MTLPTNETLASLLDTWDQTNGKEGQWFTLYDLGQAMDVVNARANGELLTRAEWEATIDKEVEAVEVPAYEDYDGARAQVGVLYEVKATVLYPGRYGIIAVGEETP